jgi:hypothetical protein
MSSKRRTKEDNEHEDRGRGVQMPCRLTLKMAPSLPRRERIETDETSRGSVQLQMRPGCIESQKGPLKFNRNATPVGADATPGFLRQAIRTTPVGWCTQQGDQGDKRKTSRKGKRAPPHRAPTSCDGRRITMMRRMGADPPHPRHDYSGAGAGRLVGVAPSSRRLLASVPLLCPAVPQSCAGARLPWRVSLTIRKRPLARRRKERLELCGREDRRVLEERGGEEATEVWALPPEHILNCAPRTAQHVPTTAGATSSTQGRRAPRTSHESRTPYIDYHARPLLYLLARKLVRNCFGTRKSTKMQINCRYQPPRNRSSGVINCRTLLATGLCEEVKFLRPASTTRL